MNKTWTVGSRVRYTDSDGAGNFVHEGVVTGVDVDEALVSLDVPDVGVLTLPLDMDKIEVLAAVKVAKPKSKAKAAKKPDAKKTPVKAGEKEIETVIYSPLTQTVETSATTPAKAKRAYTRSTTGRKLDQVVEIVRTSELKGKLLLVHVMEVVDTTLSGANSFVYQARKAIAAKPLPRRLPRLPSSKPQASIS